MKTSLDIEFNRFNHFLNEIEAVTNQIHQVSSDEINLDVSAKDSFTNEQVIINRAVTNLLSAIKVANQSLREAILVSEQKKFEDELIRTALQASHDIGSSLAVIEAIVQSASTMLPEESRIALRNAGSTIRDITNSFLKKAKRDLLSMDDGVLAQQMLASLISQIITEKRLQYQENKAINIHFNLNQSCYGLFSIVKVADFGRVLSNLINNAVESITAHFSNIFIELFSEDTYAVIRITDNGKGIPADILSKLGHLGVTYAKSNGHGLGLFYAKTTIENWGGQLDIQSVVGKRTTIKVKLPKTTPPVWYVPEIAILNGQTVMIVDDDQSTHSYVFLSNS
ncbi:MAG: HAMP domain-containing histidine kinase [Gammaproteobacteria bacterium]|nr:HAMP domain-containing histidine kinase [Gammaproteobacteria bacterium]MCW5582611.1 HAMP domain-containing histidine kinase [Gammaproteobacteria bacterium]